MHEIVLAANECSLGKDEWILPRQETNRVLVAEQKQNDIFFIKTTPIKRSKK
jgi:hypothetical protein